ncbi:hypothetical protein BDF14DRAFT_1882380 [Spinellus fusiger]|nr:hypothetical protein BDF14DRAFT_1882380 [Spinellus fusiger]
MNNASSIYPPLSFSGDFSVATPYFINATALLALITVFGAVRYFHTRASLWREGDRISSAHLHGIRLPVLSRLIVILCFFILASFLGDAVVLVVHGLQDKTWMSEILVYSISVSFSAWLVGLACLLDEYQKYGQWHWVEYTFWITAFLGDSWIGGLWAVSVLDPPPGTVFSGYDQLLLALFITRYLLECLLLVLATVQLFTSPTPESQPLLSAPVSEGYGALGALPECSTSDTKEPGAFSDFFIKMHKLLPFIWPKNDRWLQFLVFLDFALLIMGLAINVWTPLQIGAVVDRLGQGKGQFAWGAVLAYIGLRFLQGGSGLIQSLQNWLWIPMGQYTTREISVKLFSHLHSLSLDFHITRKTGEVLRVMDRGTNSVVQLLSQILFQILPALANIVLAVFVFSIKFSPPFGAIVFVTMSLYILATVVVTEWRTKFRRRMIELDNYSRTKAVDSLLNFETVKYYGAEGFEVNRYKDAIVEYQAADWKSSVSLNILNLVQNTIITAGLLAGCLLFAWEVSKGQLTSGDFVAFNIYMMQLYTPLHWFGTYYRMIQSNFIDMEKMLALFEVAPSVQDAPEAKNLVVKEGHVVFENVVFSYDPRQTALKGISFSIPKGATVALVGPSGGGKSTLLRLLFRFYDPDAGRICIDGQDIRFVRQSSLRKNIGVVPQDTVLFNDTILYNIRYGDVNAPEEKVVEAAKAAQIHDKILTFSDSYETKVGERGLRLSGGEKQRVAIARTLLKDPPIILLDEATSALDTTTERQIQKALSTMTKGRTTLVIAHRLSTIINADLILVIKEGTVVESGTHEELIRRVSSEGEQGVYSEMWQKQLHDENETHSDTVRGSDTNSNVDQSSLKESAAASEILVPAEPSVEPSVETVSVNDLVTEEPQEPVSIELEEEEEEEEEEAEAEFTATATAIDAVAEEEPTTPTTANGTQPFSIDTNPPPTPQAPSTTSPTEIETPPQEEASRTAESPIQHPQTNSAASSLRLVPSRSSTTKSNKKKKSKKSKHKTTF